MYDGCGVPATIHTPGIFQIYSVPFWEINTTVSELEFTDSVNWTSVNGDEIDIAGAQIGVTWRIWHFQVCNRSVSSWMSRSSVLHQLPINHLWLCDLCKYFLPTTILL